MRIIIGISPAQNGFAVLAAHEHEAALQYALIGIGLQQAKTLLQTVLFVEKHP